MAREPRIRFTGLHPSQMKDLLSGKVGDLLAKFHYCDRHDCKTHGNWAGGSGDEPGAQEVFDSLKGKAGVGGWKGTDAEFKQYVDAVRTIRRGNIAKTLSGATGHPVTVTPLPATVYGRGAKTGGFAEEGSPWIGKPGEQAPPAMNWLTRAELLDKTGKVLDAHNRNNNGFEGSSKDKVLKDQKGLVVMDRNGKFLDPWTHHAVYRAAQPGFTPETLKKLIDAIRTQPPMEIEKRSDQRWNNRIYVLPELPTHSISVVIDNSKKGKIATIFIENLTSAEYGTANGNASAAAITLGSPYTIMKWKDFEKGGR